MTSNTQEPTNQVVKAYIHQHKIIEAPCNREALLHHISYESSPEDSMRDLVVWSEEYSNILSELAENKFNVFGCTFHHESTIEIPLGSCRSGSILILSETLMDQPLWSIEVAD